MNDSIKKNKEEYQTTRIFTEDVEVLKKNREMTGMPASRKIHEMLKAEFPRAYKNSKIKDWVSK
jgi:hypothetical protein